MDFHQYLQDNSISIRELHQRSNVSVKSLERYCNPANNAKPNQVNRDRLKTALGISLSELDEMFGDIIKSDHQIINADSFTPLNSDDPVLKSVHACLSQLVSEKFTISPPAAEPKVNIAEAIQHALR